VYPWFLIIPLISTLESPKTVYAVIMNWRDVAWTISLQSNSVSTCVSLVLFG
jgi:hypothetical protein